MNNIYKNYIQTKKGSALMLALFMLAGMLVVAMGIGNIVISGIKTSRVQTDSTKAFYAAESGIEKTLFEIRKNNFDLLLYGDQDDIFNGSISLSNGSSFVVNYASSTTSVFTSVGTFNNTKRSVQISF